MADTKTKQMETMAYIDTAMAVTGKIMALMGILKDSPSFSFKVSANPIELILNILDRLGVSREDMVNFLSKYIVWLVPVLEVGVKSIILTNLKHMVSCSIDPRIPIYLRKPIGGGTDTELGIDVSVDAIDPLGKLQVSPFSDEGSMLYFGTEGSSDIGSLARCSDFDAFLWFVIHCGRFPSSGNFDALKNVYDVRMTSSGNRTNTASIFNAVDCYGKDGQENLMKVGSTFTSSTYGQGSCVAMCKSVEYITETSNGETRSYPYKSTIVPISSDRNSLNWYADPKKSFKNLGGSISNYEWNYANERPICNLKYIDETSSTSKTELTSNSIKFMILPKPYINGIGRLNLNADGQVDFGEGYSVKNGNGVNVPSNIRIGDLGRPKITNATNAHKDMYACYNGLTVYEFNYDYLMSLRLFDAKVLTASLIESLCGLRMGLGIDGVNKTIEARDRVVEIIKNIVSQDEIVDDDCYFSFSNARYDKMLQETARKRAMRYDFGNATHGVGDVESALRQLEELDTATELNMKEKIISRVIDDVSVAITEEVDEKFRYGVRFSFVIDLVNNLALTIIECILTPKVLLLFEVNSKLMGGTWEKPSFEDLLSSLSDMIVSIVKEVRDMIVSELYKYMISILQPIITTLNDMILKEVLESYMNVLRDIMRNCPFIWFKFKAKDIDTKLDNVDYADIDESELNNGDKPQISNC